jgi:long-chain acyl-CoA synthetase
MRGYWKDEETTARTIVDGWLHTGDIGVIEPDGYLKITDRKKDIIVNSGGDNVSPQRVEGVLLLEPEIGQAFIYGDKKPYLVALISPDADAAKAFARETGKPADMAELAQDQGFRQRIGEAVKRANANLSAIERIRKFEIMTEPFSVDNGLMTPTLKLRRPLHHRTARRAPGEPLRRRALGRPLRHPALSHHDPFACAAAMTASAKASTLSHEV